MFVLLCSSGKFKQVTLSTKYAALSNRPLHYILPAEGPGGRPPEPTWAAAAAVAQWGVGPPEPPWATAAAAAVGAGGIGAVR